MSKPTSMAIRTCPLLFECSAKLGLIFDVFGVRRRIRAAGTVAGERPGRRGRVGRRVKVLLEKFVHYFLFMFLKL